MAYFCVWQNCILTLLYLVQSKCSKMHQEEILSIGLNVLEFLCVSLYTEFLSDFNEMFQVESTCDKNEEYQT